jgi:hypothetical protein
MNYPQEKDQSEYNDASPMAPQNPKLRKRKRKNQNRNKNRYRTKEHNNSLVPQKQAAQIYRDFQHNSSALQTLDLRRRRSWKLVFRRNL